MGAPCERIGSPKFGGRCYQHRAPTDSDRAKAKERRMRKHAIDEAQFEYNCAATAVLDAKENVVKTAEAWANGEASPSALQGVVIGLRLARRTLATKKKHLDALPRPETKG